MLFTSLQGFVVYSKQQFMKYDIYNIDPKSFICFNCNDLGIFSAPPLIDFHKSIFWIEDRYQAKEGHTDMSYLITPLPTLRKVNDHLRPGAGPNNNTQGEARRGSFIRANPDEVGAVRTEHQFKKGVLNRLVYTDQKTLIEFSSFKLSEIKFDFSVRLPNIITNTNKQPIKTWNEEERNQTVRIHFENFVSKLNSQDFYSLLELPKILLKLASTQTKPEPSPGTRQVDEKDTNEVIRSVSASAAQVENNRMLNDFESIGSSFFAEYLKEGINRLIRTENSKAVDRKYFIVKFLLRRISLTMTNMDAVPKMQANIDNLMFQSKVNRGISTTHTVSIHNIKILEVEEPPKLDLAVNYSRNEDLANPRRTSLVEAKVSEEKYILRPRHEVDINNAAAGSELLTIKQTVYSIPNLSAKEKENIQIRYFDNGEQDLPRFNRGNFAYDAKDQGFWKVVDALEINLNDMEVNVKLEHYYFLKEYIFVQEMNKMYKHLEDIEEKNKGHRVGEIHTDLHRGQRGLLQE